jgi:hypothetical protein
MLGYCITAHTKNQCTSHGDDERSLGQTSQGEIHGTAARFLETG